jgi:hypothetical protein
MRLPWPSRGHSQWREDIDAYVDGQLDAEASARLEAHLGTCGACQEMVVARREVKRFAATLPEMPAPRTFRITPGMLVHEQRAPEPRRGGTIVMRLGQATAGVAALAFGAVLVAHLSSGTNDDGGRQAADADAQTMSISNEAGSAAALGATDSGMPSPQPTAAMPEFNDATVGGASNPPTELPKAANDDSHQRDAASSGGQPLTASPASPPGAEVEPARASEDGDSDTGFLVAEVALGALVIAALGAWVIARRARRV